MSAIFNIGVMREMQIAVVIEEWLLTYGIQRCVAAAARGRNGATAEMFRCAQHDFGGDMRVTAAPFVLPGSPRPSGLKMPGSPAALSSGERRRCRRWRR